MTVESYGNSYEGRDLWIATITDSSTGAHDTKPAHWVDANIHAIEVTGGVAALYLIHHLVTGFGNDPHGHRGAAHAHVLRRSPREPRRCGVGAGRLARSSAAAACGRGRGPTPTRRPACTSATSTATARSCRCACPTRTAPGWCRPTSHASWCASRAEGAPAGAQRYRMLYEGDIVDHDGFTVPAARPPQSLDMNRNFPAGWGTTVHGSGDHPLSEPEIDGLVRAHHRPPQRVRLQRLPHRRRRAAATQQHAAGHAMPTVDVWVWKRARQAGSRRSPATRCTRCSRTSRSTSSDTMSGAADDWVYEHVGVYGWTTEFWDVIQQATGRSRHTHIWYVGPTDDEELAVYRWAVEHHARAATTTGRRSITRSWAPVEIGGWDEVFLWANAPASELLAEVRRTPSSPCTRRCAHRGSRCCTPPSIALGGDSWRVEVGIANTGWLPTHVTVKAAKDELVLPLVAELSRCPVVGGHGAPRARSARRPAEHALHYGKNDGTPERVLATWVVQAPAGTEVHVAVQPPARRQHQA